jgi:hypothetical protein
MFKSAVLDSILNIQDKINTVPKHCTVEVPDSDLARSDYPYCDFYETQQM